jgi:toxin HigB-1
MSLYTLQKSVIRSFAHKGLKRLYEADDRSKLAADLVDRIATILAALDEAVRLEDLDRPSFRLHPLKGNLKGRWSITVRANWRIVFHFEDGDAYDVDFLDYH